MLQRYVLPALPASKVKALPHTVVSAPRFTLTDPATLTMTGMYGLLHPPLTPATQNVSGPTVVNTGVVNDDPVPNGVPPVAELYHVNVPDEPEAVNVAVLFTQALTGDVAVGEVGIVQNTAP